MTQAIPFGPRSTADQVLAGVDLSRKRVLVTACSSLTGLETMKALEANGAVVIGVARTLDDAEAACRAVNGSTPLALDPTRPESLDAAEASLRVLSSPLDAVIINASHVRCFADHIARFVLVNRLVEFVRPGTGRIAIARHEPTTQDLPEPGLLFDDLTDDRIYDPGALHGETALAAAVFAEELSRRVDARGISVNEFDSGTATRNPRSRPLKPPRMIRALLNLWSRSPGQWAATPALLAASPLVAGITGKYWLDCQISRRNPEFKDGSLASRLWDLSVKTSAMMFGRVNSSRTDGLASHMATGSGA